ncbi:MAG: ribosomal protein S18-alanine N-acetyltransferase [Clostridia bacterium]|nr:ribosomal protein S18-alanine N-acetyltransferase [Clostridia bacterium]
MTFRKITIEDIPFLEEPKKKDFLDCWNSEQYLSSFNSGRFFGLIAEEDGVKLGFITITLGVEEADIESVYVIKEFRKQGVARELVKKAIEQLGDIKKFFLEVRESNIPAISLYTSLGFKQISIRKKYYFDGENALVFIKE